MNTPLVSVVIDTYNYGRYIEEAVGSVLAQDFPAEEREILVVDDGSTDDTQERLRQFGDSIRYLQKANGGQASAFNFGFEQARGEIVALLDADDLWLPGKLRRVCETLEKNVDAGMVYHRVYLWRGGSELSEDTYFVPVSGRVPENRAALLRYPMVGTSCLAFRRTALEKLLPIPEALQSQADAYLTALIIFVAPVAALPEFLGRYRIHGANLFQTNVDGMSHSRVEHRLAMRSVLLAEIQNWLGRYGYDLASPELQAYLKQWTKAQELDGFILNVPSRWKYFRHLWEYPRIYGENMTARHRIYSYMKAISALILGYHHLHLMDDFRHRYKRLTGDRYEDSFLPEQERAVVVKDQQ